MHSWSSITSPPDLSFITLSNATAVSYMMFGWSSCTTPPDMSNFTPSNCTNFVQMMGGWSAMGEIDIPIDTWDISKALDMTNMLAGSALTTACYDRTLIADVALKTAEFEWMTAKARYDEALAALSKALVNFWDNSLSCFSSLASKAFLK